MGNIVEQKFKSAFDLNHDQRTGFTGLSRQTQLRTPVGPRRIEHMRVGDLIVTRDFGLLPVRLIFCTEIDKTAMLASPDNAPVRISQRAVGPMMPARDLILAPAQRIVMPAYLLSCDVEGNGGLIEARSIAGTSDLVWCDRSAETEKFYNIVFDRHAVFHAEGLPVESFRPTPESLRDLGEDQRTDLSRTFPVLQQKQSPFPALPLQQVRGRDYLPSFA